jgi:hypothetical protein
MEPNRISYDEKEKMNGSACELFKIRNPDYWPSPVNSHKLVSFLEQNLGMTIAEYPYVVGVDIWQNCYDYLKVTSFFIERPEEIIEEDPAVTRERLAQKKVVDDHAARVAAEKTARDKAMPLSELGAKVSQQNAQFREQRDQNLLPTRSTGMESRAVSTVPLGPKAQARVNVGNANPGLDTHSAEFVRLYALELQKLRQQ